MNSSTRTPIVFIQEFHLGHDTLNQKLEENVLEEMNRKKDQVQHSNIGGWQSERDLHARLQDGTPLSLHLLKLFESFSAPMMEYINGCCARCNINPSSSYDWDYTGAWFNVATRGGYNAPHTHPFSEISGSYYIRTEEPSAEYPFSGRIDFYYENGDNHFFPKPGTLLLFPSTMLHFVHPYYGSGNRISLSFNVNRIRVLNP